MGSGVYTVNHRFTSGLHATVSGRLQSPGAKSDLKCVTTYLFPSETTYAFPKNTELVLDQEFEGGEIFHDYFAARGRFLEYTKEFEEKIEQILHHDQYIFKMVFCGNGKWHQSHLEDFADFYRTAPKDTLWPDSQSQEVPKRTMARDT